MIRGNARGGVVSPTIGDAERMEPEIGREVDDPFGSVDRRPRAREARDGALRVTGQGLEWMQRADNDVGTALNERVEHVEAARAREVHHERAGSQRRCERDGGVGDRGVGRRDDHDAGIAARVTDLDGGRGEARGRARRGGRVRSATGNGGHGVPPPGERERDRGTGSAGPHEGDATCVTRSSGDLVLHETSSFQPSVGAGLLVVRYRQL